MTTLSRRLVRLVAGLTAALGAMAVLAPAADAAPYAAGGTRGTHTIVRPTCRYFPTWNQVDLTASTPNIYAANLLAGNESQPVRYRVFVVDLRTGQTVQSSAYSGVAIAWDYSPAVFSGAPATFRLPAGQNQYRIDYRIEWLRSDNYGLSAWVADQATSYTYYIGQSYPYSPIDRCMGVSYAF